MILSPPLSTSQLCSLITPLQSPMYNATSGFCIVPPGATFVAPSTTTTTSVAMATKLNQTSPPVALLKQLGGPNPEKSASIFVKASLALHQSFTSASGMAVPHSLLAGCASKEGIVIENPPKKKYKRKSLSFILVNYSK